MKAVASGVVVLQSQTCTVQMNNCVRDGTVMSRMTPQKHHMYCNSMTVTFQVTNEARVLALPPHQGKGPEKTQV